MSGLIALSPTGDWTYGAAILSFVFPELLFIFVAGGLWVAYTMPHLNPGEPRENPDEAAEQAAPGPAQEDSEET